MEQVCGKHKDQSSNNGAGQKSEVWKLKQSLYNENLSIKDKSTIIVYRFRKRHIHQIDVQKVIL